MGSIPLPALDIKAPPQQDPLASLGKAVQMKTLLQGQQLQQGQLQLQQQQIKDQQAVTDAMKTWDGKDYDALKTSVLKNGGSANAALAVEQHGLGIKKTISDIAATDATTGSKNLETYIGAHKAVGDAITGLKAVPDEQLHDAAIAKVNDLAQGGILDQKTAQGLTQQIQGIQDPTALRAQLDSFGKLSLGAKAVAEQAHTEAQTRAENASAELKLMEAKEHGSPLTAFENDPTKMAGEKLPAAIGYLQSKIAEPNVDPVDKARATRLLATAELNKKAELAIDYSKKQTAQTIQEGDPIAAGKMLAQGIVSPSQIVSARRPDFAQKAFSAAQQADPNWNAQKAEADFNVAKSPANLAFFGSAKSLTDKGGTLDQLAAAGKDIPQGQIPVFNSVADAIKASTGSGPVAKYAAIALGVADDYAKVMGGGQGSDTARTQALKIISASQSPEQRTASLEGIRGAVGSQTNSRIGGNTVLQRMYSNGETKTAPAAAAPGAMTRIQASDGSLHDIPTANLDKARKIDPTLKVVNQ